MSLPLLPNAAARKLFLSRHGLLDAPRGRDAGGVIRSLGFVQLDSVLTLARAHDAILWARAPLYRPPDLRRLLQRREAFEHWTHDASVLPVAAWPHWRHRFARARARIEARHPGEEGARLRAEDEAVLARVAAGGEVRSSDLLDGPRGTTGGWWDWHPGKAALERLWHVGELSVARREGFQKVYDLTERVIPEAARAAAPGLEETVAWAGAGALDRLGFATPGEVAAFYALLTPQEAQAWARGALGRGEAVELLVEGADGSRRRSLARPGAVEEAASLPEPGDRVRLLSPFDPALRDRARAERLFGFRYRVEMFVPAARRAFGYYVFPVLEGARLLGRADVDGKEGAVTLRAFWPEAGVRMGAGRTARLVAELERVAAFVGAGRVDVLPGWLRG